MLQHQFHKVFSMNLLETQYGSSTNWSTIRVAHCSAADERDLLMLTDEAENSRGCLMLRLGRRGGVRVPCYLVWVMTVVQYCAFFRPVEAVKFWFGTLEDSRPCW